MNYDEFGFFNQQLAGMLRDGIPLEGGVKQLSAHMGSGRLKEELLKLEGDLSQGKPLIEAVQQRDLPPFYKQMVTVGVRGNNLPAILLLLADYYHRLNQIRDRLRGLMVYPTLVLGTALALSIGLLCLANSVSHLNTSDLASLFGRRFSFNANLLVLPPLALGILFLAVLAGIFVPSWWRYLRWRLPAFREAALSQFASAMALMLEYGGNLKEAIGLMQQLEKESPLGTELSVWAENLAKGAGKFSGFATPGRVVPPLFIWLVANAGEDIAGGFRQAAQIYYDRAVHRVEMMLYAALPVAVLFLGAMIISEMLPVTRMIVAMLDAVGSFGD
jgi:type II secretory pathway component PulF